MDTRSYDDKKKLFEGVSIKTFDNFILKPIIQFSFFQKQNSNYQQKGYIALYAESKDKTWQNRQELFLQRTRCEIIKNNFFLCFMCVATMSIYYTQNINVVLSNIFFIICILTQYPSNETNIFFIVVQ